jgi:hypothetical protein
METPETNTASSGDDSCLPGSPIPGDQGKGMSVEPRRISMREGTGRGQRFSQTQEKPVEEEGIQSCV